MSESVIQVIVDKLVEYLVGALKNQVSYLCCYSYNAQTLADEVGELNTKRGTLQERLNLVLANCEVITQEVEAWLKKVEELQTRSQQILSDAKEVRRSMVRKWLPMLHYSLSRKALKMTNDSFQLRKIEFSNISIPVIPADMPLVPTTSIVRFKSRESIEEGIVDALKNPSVYSIGIWGIGGVGKTVLAKKIERRIRDDKSFERIVMVVVSQQPSISKIQHEIAEAFGLSLTEENKDIRQKKLHQRLLNEKGILIILDDLWESLNLEDVGIPSQSSHAGCKLILTSRNKDALTSSGVLDQNIFRLETLNEEESWRFFKDKANIKENGGSDNELVQIAKKVERECMGLPLALNIVACSLKGKGMSSWNTALRELEKHAPDNIPGLKEGVYKSILFSINALEGKEHKDIFLLCCLFPEDYLISTDELLRRVMGLRIFKELGNLIEARERLESVLNILLSRSLLIKGDHHDNFKVKMHDVIRDVGIWIEKPVFLVKYGVNEWPTVDDDYVNDYTFISLHFSHRRISFPESIICPKLKFLHYNFVHILQKFNRIKLPNNLFREIGELRVLEASHIQLLPPSMSQLNNLYTLVLESCTIFETISIIGKLINLEMLILRNCEFDILPSEIRSLRKLRQMDISHCISLRRIANGVISALAKLEELIILDSFDNWKAEHGGNEDVACLSELNELKKLTILKIDIRDSSILPKQKPHWVQKLKKFHITVSKGRYEFHDFLSGAIQKAICLGKVSDPLENWVYNLTNGAEYIDFEGSNCKEFVKRLYENSWNLSCLKKLRLAHFTNIQYLSKGLQKGAIFPVLCVLHIEGSDSLQQIVEASPPIDSFEALQRIKLVKLSSLVCLWIFSIKEQLYLGNLQVLEIIECHKLSYIFSLCVVQSLAHLSELDINHCQALEEIFRKVDGESMEINEIKLPKLRKIKFSKLDNFYNLCNQIDRIEVSELRELTLCELPRVNAFKGNKNEIHQILFDLKIVGINLNFCWLTHLDLHNIENFKCLFSLSTIHSGLSNLKSLWIRSCSNLEQIIEKDDKNIERTVIISKLENLILQDLPNLRSFCYHVIQMPSLENIHVRRCPQLLYFVGNLPNHISNSSAFLDKQVKCSRLKWLIVDSLNIRGLFSSSFFNSLTILEWLDVYNCEELENVITKREGEEELMQRVPIKKFILFKLPKLNGSIFQSEHILEFPLLENIEIKDCPMLEKFSIAPPNFPNLKRVSGFLNSEFAANFFFGKKDFFNQIQSEDNDICFIVSTKDISFIGHAVYKIFLQPSDLSENFFYVVSISSYDLEKHEILGEFKIEKIQVGVEYEIILMIMFWNIYTLEGSIEIELKLPEGRKLQRIEVLDDLPLDTWIEMSLGKFMGEKSQQTQVLKFSVRKPKGLSRSDEETWIKGFKIIKV